MTVLGGGTFRKYLGHKGGTLVNELSVLIRDPRALSPPPPPRDGTRRSRLSASCMRSLTRTQPLWGHDLGLLASRNVRIKFRWFISFPVCGILVTAAQTDYESEERQSKHMLFCSTTEEIPKGENKLINPSKIFN